MTSSNSFLEDSRFYYKPILHKCCCCHKRDAEKNIPVRGEIISSRKYGKSGALGKQYMVTENTFRVNEYPVCSKCYNKRKTILVSLIVLWHIIIPTLIVIRYDSFWNGLLMFLFIQIFAYMLSGFSQLVIDKIMFEDK